MDAPEITSLGKEKCSEPLFAAAMRLAICAPDSATVKECLFRIATAITSCGSKNLNQLTVLPAPFIGTLVDSIVSRTSRRTGMILSLSDLANFVHVPSDAVQSNRLVRLSARTKAAPATSVNAYVPQLGQNTRATSPVSPISTSWSQNGQGLRNVSVMTASL